MPPGPVSMLKFEMGATRSRYSFENVVSGMRAEGI
jgi:hypothetical protein